ncbi:hypothetical protein ACFYW1_34375 [Streptomyces sp. NPDC002669]|uniref:hypothetical protein n=1 Tax=Streptomyces sp. NPDC002669 TaxID=3364658 RepID=UPI00369233F8
MTSEDETVNGWCRAVAVPEGGAEDEGGDVPPVLPGAVPVAVAVLPVVADGAIVAVPSGGAGTVEVPEGEGALGDTSGVAGGAEADGLVVGCGPGWLGSTRAAWPGSRDSPMLRPATARTEPTALRAARLRWRARTLAQRRSRCLDSNGAGAVPVSRIICASCRSK